MLVATSFKFGFQKCSMRCFLALEIGPAAKALGALQSELREAGVSGSFPLPDRMHATLCFFGEITPEEAAKKAKALDTFKAKAPEALYTTASGFGGFQAFDASLAGVGFFPSVDFPKVAWAGFGNGSEEITRLQAEAATLLGYAGEKPFFPHVTLARIRRVDNHEALKAWAAKHEGEEFVAFKAETVTLYESRLSPQGPEYFALKKVALG